MKSLYSTFSNNLKRWLPAAILFAFAVPALADKPEDSKVISEVIRAQSVVRYLPQFKTGLVVNYNGQKYYLAEGQKELVLLSQAQTAEVLPELEVLKYKTRKAGEKVRLKMRFQESIVKTTARVCVAMPEGASCKPCNGPWQIKFLSTRKQGKKMPDYFLFIS